MEPYKNLPFTRRMGFAFSGIAGAIRTEQSLRIQFAVVPVLALLLALLRVEPLWWALSGLSCATVLAAELLNTALERLCDHLHPAQHPAVGAAKDCAAGAVLITCLGALAVAGALAVHLYQRGLLPR